MLLVPNLRRFILVSSRIHERQTYEDGLDAARKDMLFGGVLLVLTKLETSKTTSRSRNDHVIINVSALQMFQESYCRSRKHFCCQVHLIT